MLMESMSYTEFVARKRIFTLLLYNKKVTTIILCYIEALFTKSLKIKIESLSAWMILKLPLLRISQLKIEFFLRCKINFMIHYQEKTQKFNFTFLG
jgi:hypothetical protein